MGNGKGGGATNTRLCYVDPDISGVIWMLMYSVAIYILIEWFLYLLRTVLAIGFGVVDVIFSMALKMLPFGCPPELLVFPDWPTVRGSGQAPGDSQLVEICRFSELWWRWRLFGTSAQGIQCTMCRFKLLSGQEVKEASFFYVSLVGARHVERRS